MSDSPSTTIPLPNPDVFIRSPVVRREARFSFKITQEEFDEKVPSLITQLEQDGQLSGKKMKEVWKFELDLKSGKAPKPKVTMRQIPELHRVGGKPLTLQLFPPDNGQPASLILSQPFRDENPTRFADLMEECREWVPKVFTHFEIIEPFQVALGYRNEITKLRYPDLWIDDETLHIGDLWRVFNYMPNPELAVFAAGFVIDYTRLYEERQGRTLKVKVNSEQPTPTSICWVATFVFESGQPELKGKDIEAAFSELAVGHSAIYQEFCDQFGQGALDLFSK